MTNLVCTVATSFSQVDERLEKEWDELAARTNAGIFMTFRWVRTWWDYYGGSYKPRIYFVRREETLSAVLPVYVQRVRLGPARMFVAHLMGSDVPPRVFDPPIEAIQADEIIGLIVRKLISDERCDLISLGPVSEQWADRTGVRTSSDVVLREMAKLAIIASNVYTYHQLPQNFDDYYNGLSQKERRIRRQKMNIFTKDFHPQMEVLTDPGQIDAELGQFMDMHNAQWIKERMMGYFGGWPKAAVFNKAVAHELATLGRTWLMKITVDNKPILYQYAYVLGENCCWISSARTEGEEWERYSLGATNVFFFLKHCVEKGIKRVESGLGHFEYKIKLGGIEAPAVILRYSSARSAGRIKYAVYRLISGIVDLFYHKIYYNRIQHRLPAKYRRPNWLGWIRLRY